jgi:hypothetical protein
MRSIAYFICAIALAMPAQAFGDSTKPVYMTACLGMTPQVKPALVVLACGDGGGGIKDLDWADWGGDRAHARGTVWRRVCVPDCAQGHDQTFPAAVTAYGKKTCPHGHDAYESIKYLIVESGKPEVVTSTFSCAGL